MSLALRDAMAQVDPGCRVRAYAVMASQLSADSVTNMVGGLQGRNRRAAVARILQAHSAATQGAARSILDEAIQAGAASSVEVLWMGNALIFEGEPAVIETLAKVPGVDRICLAATQGSPYFGGAASLAQGSYPFADDFEAGTLGPEWTVTVTGGGEVKVTSLDDPIGSFHVEMDSALNGIVSTASITISLDLSGEQDVGIRFAHKQFHDEPDVEDGVFVSVDSVTWVKAQSLAEGTPDYSTHYVQLDSIMAEAGLAYGKETKIRFQWRDDFAIPTDGFGFDDIAVAPGIGAPEIPSPEPNVSALQAPGLWAMGIDGSGQLVGVIDTGVWIDHPDLANRIWTNAAEVPENGIDDDGNGKIDDLHGWDFVHDGPNVTSGDAHGTQVAGIVCGDGSSGVKLTGMAPGASLLACEVGGPTDFWEAQQYCLAAGVDVIVSSYADQWSFIPKPDFHMYRQLCDMELAADIVHASAAGNQGDSLSTDPIPFNLGAPAVCPSPFVSPEQVFGGRSAVMACGGIELSGDSIYVASAQGPAAWENMTMYLAFWPYSQDATYWDYPFGGFGGGGPGLVKPDVVAYTNVGTTTIGSGYAALGGTSAATPHVGGALCLLLDSQPQAEPRHLAAALELTASDLGSPGKDNVYGSGKIQVKDAARRLVVLGRFDNQQPSVGGTMTLDLFGPPHVNVFWLASLAVVDDGTDFNLAPPFFVVAGFVLDQSGHLAVPLSIPADPALSGLTLWSQFTAKGGAPLWGSPRFWSVPEDLTIE